MKAQGTPNTLLGNAVFGLVLAWPIAAYVARDDVPLALGGGLLLTAFGGLAAGSGWNLARRTDDTLAMDRAKRLGVVVGVQAGLFAVAGVLAAVLSR